MAFEMVVLTVGGLALLAVVLAMAIRVDGKDARLCGLVKNGVTVDGWRVVCATRWVNVRAGLLNQAGMAPHTGLWLTGARSVHTCGMLFPIDVVFLGTDGRVLVVHPKVEPGVVRLQGPKGAAAALELAAEGAAAIGLEIGAHLTLARRS